MKRAVLLLTLCACLGCLGAFAQPLIVYSLSPEWLSLGPTGGADPVYILPATTICGSENEPSCEPRGYWFFNQTWAGLPSYISFTSQDGTLSDILIADSLGPGGAFRMVFYSDPSLPSPSLYAGYVHYTDILETDAGAVSGSIPVCCILGGNFLNIVLASDGEAPFDPFGSGFDTSDGIQFQGAIDGGTVPEPTSLLLIGSGLLGALGYARRRFVS